VQLPGTGNCLSIAVLVYRDKRRMVYAGAN
jgi:hypothetical protein